MSQTRIEPIEDSRKTIAAIVQERIRQAILDGSLPGGSRLDQVQLATDLNVSLVPVREALKKLEAEGFVNIVPRRGAFVTETSAQDMEELYAARTTLEGQAAYLAAESLSEKDLNALHSLAHSMSQALQKQDYERFMSDNREFHFTIYRAAANRYLLNMIASLWDLSERYRFRYLMLENQSDVVQHEHDAILDACAKRSKPLLRDAIIQHMQHTLATIRSASNGDHSS